MAEATWTKFLISYDAVAKRRGEAWVEPISKALVALDVLGPDELIGMVFDEEGKDALLEKWHRANTLRSSAQS